MRCAGRDRGRQRSGPHKESPASPPEGPPDAPPKGGSEDVSPPGTRALSDDELGEAKKALRFAERNVDDLSRSNLRSVRRHLGSSDGGPITMDPDDWDLLSDAQAAEDVGEWPLAVEVVERGKYGRWVSRVRRRSDGEDLTERLREEFERLDT